MFAPDVVSLRQFYLTPFGEGVRALIAASLQRFWPSAPGDVILGIGYSTPYLEPYLKEAASLLVSMPARQGAAYWPPSGMNVVMLSHESELPLAENSVNRVLMVHSVENSEELSGMMHEVWRVLTPGGRMLAIVPNRLGFWSRSAKSPFGYGRPFSMAQLRALIDEHHFTLTGSGSALFIPPTHLGLIWKGADRMERIGRVLFRFVGGVLLIEAEKQVYAAIHQPVAAATRRPAPIPVATRPVPVNQRI